MIEGFEDQTAPLSDDERAALPNMVALLLNSCQNSSQKHTANEFQNYLERVYPNTKFGGPRIRKMMNHIRRNKLVYPVISFGKGYWIGTPDELAIYMRSLDQRISAIQAMKDSFDPPETSQVELDF